MTALQRRFVAAASALLLALLVGCGSEPDPVFRQYLAPDRPTGGELAAELLGPEDLPLQALVVAARHSTGARGRGAPAGFSWPDLVVLEGSDPGCRTVLAPHGQPVSASASTVLVDTRDATQRTKTVSEEVDAFSSRATAQKVMQEYVSAVNSCRTFRAVYTWSGQVLTFRHSRFAVPALGDEAIGHRITVDTPGASLEPREMVQVRSGSSLVYLSTVGVNPVFLAEKAMAELRSQVTL